VNSGEFLGIMRASGSGKTTLLNVLSTIDSQLSKYPNELSRWQKQRVADVRAMVKQPPLIFDDELTGALDSNSAMEFLVV